MSYKLPLQTVSIEEDGVHIFIKGRINGKPARFLIDTGASRTVLDRNRIGRFMDPEEGSLEKLGKFSAGLGTNTMESEQVVVKRLSFSRLHFDHYLAAALDLKHVNESYRMLKMKEIDGVIGGDLLQRLNAVIDYGKREIRF